MKQCRDKKQYVTLRGIATAVMIEDQTCQLNEKTQSQQCKKNFPPLRPILYLNAIQQQPP